MEYDHELFCLHTKKLSESSLKSTCGPCKPHIVQNAQA